jgi:hypothetical protein
VGRQFKFCGKTFGLARAPAQIIPMPPAHPFIPFSTTPKHFGVDANCARVSDERLAIATANAAASAKDVRVILIVNMSMIPSIHVRRSYFGPKRIEAEKHTVVKFRPTMDAIAFVYVDGQRRSQ